MCAEKRTLSTGARWTLLSVVWKKVENLLFENSAARKGQSSYGGLKYGGVPTGVKGGELKVGVGSRVERAEAPVSPRGSAPRPLDFRRGRGIFLQGENIVGMVYRYDGKTCCGLKNTGSIIHQMSRAEKWVFLGRLRA